MTPDNRDPFAAHTPEVTQDVNFRPRRKVLCTTSLFYSTRPILALHDYIGNSTPSSLDLSILNLCLILLSLIFAGYRKTLCPATYKKPKFSPEHRSTSQETRKEYAQRLTWYSTARARHNTP